AGLFIWSMSMSASKSEKEQAAHSAKAKTEAVENSPKTSNSSLQVPELSALDTTKLVPATLAPTADGKVAVKDSTKDSSAVAPVAQKIGPRKIRVENDHFIAVFDNRGAKISSIIVKALPDSNGKFPEIIADTLEGALSLKIDKADLSEQLFAVKDGTPDSIQVNSDTSVVFTFTDPNGNKVVRNYRISKDGVSIKHTTTFEGFRPNDYELSWNGGMRETEEFPKGRSFGGGSYFFSEVIFNNMYSVERETVHEKTKFNSEEGKILWAGLRRKYVAAVVKFPEPTEATLSAEPLNEVKKNSKDPGTYKIVLSDYMHDNDTLAFDFMILPLNWSEVEHMGNGFEKIIVSGWTWCGADVWFVAICGFLLWLLKVFYSVIPNYGVAIILLTILVKLITSPLTFKQLRSTREMSKIKPELDAINVKYRAEPQKKQAAIMELYAKHHINPMASCTGGCLPMLIQMPIFFGLFMVFGRAIELRGMPFVGWISDLSRSDVIWSGINIPFIMPDGLAILPIIMVFTTYFQTKQSMGAMTDPTQQKMMTWMMPAMMFLFSAVMPSGLVLYWIVSNLWGIGQYALINRAYNKKEIEEKPSMLNKFKGKVQDAVIVKTKKKK
ncbi:MAG: YidC/Oxa1 family insertase periplasmic-domain containing protein, partial [Fibrobacteraceae bacterium]|nr:YidC/Oxa1 family insertase periplasmic-domain containing protein [Fibrobacteraceae bacterium]